MVTAEYSEAIVEILDILQHSDNSITEKIPKQLIKFWQTNQSTTYKPVLDHTKEIHEMHLKPKTKSILAMIYLNYLCAPEEKRDIQLRLKVNEDNYQQKIREKYNPNTIFN